MVTNYMVDRLEGLKVEILLATYNGEDYVADQIDSILNQTHNNWTIIARDDGSTDRTLDILKAYQLMYGDKVVIIKNEFSNNGPMKNFEYLMRCSKAQYLMFCDQDDIWYPDKVREMLTSVVNFQNKLSERTPILVHSDLEVVDLNLNTVAESMFEYQSLNKSPTFSERLVKNNVTGCALIFNRETLKVSMPIPKKAVMHDWWMALQVEKHGGVVVFLDKPLLKYRQHVSNSVGAKKVSFTYYFKKVFTLGLLFRSWKQVYLQANLVNGTGLFRFLWLKVRCLVRL